MRQPTYKENVLFESGGIVHGKLSLRGWHSGIVMRSLTWCVIYRMCLEPLASFRPSPKS